MKKTNFALKELIGTQLNNQRLIHKEEISEPSNFRAVEYAKIIDEDNYDVS
jgi:hypothetical protein